MSEKWEEREGRRESDRRGGLKRGMDERKKVEGRVNRIK